MFFAVFVEHNREMRYKFFAHPLVKFLWQKYITQSPQTLRSYLDKLSSDKKHGRIKIRAVRDEISSIEQFTKNKILPDEGSDIPTLGKR